MKKLEILDKIEKIVYVTQPSPVILVSTISKDNVENVDENKYSDNKVTLRNNIPNIYHITGNKFMIDRKIEEV